MEQYTDKQIIEQQRGKIEELQNELEEVHNKYEQQSEKVGELCSAHLEMHCEQCVFKKHAPKDYPSVVRSRDALQFENRTLKNALGVSANYALKNEWPDLNCNSCEHEKSCEETTCLECFMQAFILKGNLIADKSEENSEDAESST